MSNFTVYISYTYHKMQKFIRFLDNVLILKKCKGYYKLFIITIHHKSKTTSLTKVLKYDLKI